jgi:hypothetical protein
VLDDKVPCLVLSYSNRINAEQALARGRQFKDKALAVCILLFCALFYSFSIVSLSEISDL